jgi:lipopolysaccharide transport system ATP-binding protein
MSDIVLRVEGLSKRYRIGADQSGNVSFHRYKSLRDSLGGVARRPVHALRSALIREPMDESNSFWALRDINFEIKTGEVVGIIGRNGAGKSTLLKILSRITKPTVGHVALYGRIGSLLEVGTGFHPELTGRENIYLNGAVLGMTHAEVKARFNEIVAFSEIDKFLDTAVKHYSSGMYMRLAFAVAAHLEPEILVVDEVLAVGDGEFQRKCLGKMGEVARQGRTVLFVSHSMAAIRTLCGRAILLSQGKVVADGPTDAVLSLYERSWQGAGAQRVWGEDSAPGSDRVKLLSVSLQTPDLGPVSTISRTDDAEVVVQFAVRTGGLRLNPHIHLFNGAGQLLFISTNLHDPLFGKTKFETGTYTARCKIPSKLLNSGPHDVTVYVIEGLSTWEVAVNRVISFEVGDDGSDRGDYVGGWAGLIRPTLDWKMEGPAQRTPDQG